MCNSKPVGLWWSFSSFLLVEINFLMEIKYLVKNQLLPYCHSLYDNFAKIQAGFIIFIFCVSPPVFWVFQQNKVSFSMVFLECKFDSSISVTYCIIYCDFKVLGGVLPYKLPVLTVIFELCHRIIPVPLVYIAVFINKNFAKSIIYLFPVQRCFFLCFSEQISHLF